MKPGKLYLIPTPLGESDPLYHLPPATLNIIKILKRFIVEERKSARRFLKKAGFSGSLDDDFLLLFNEHTDQTDLSPFLQPLINGEDVGLMSETGVPCVADPGADIVAAAHRSAIPVIPLTGPSSILLALMASGFNGQHYIFHGYLPIDKKERVQKIRDMERHALSLQQTQLFIETPYRNQSLLDTLISACKPSTLICVAMALGTAEETVMVKPAGTWKNTPSKLDKRPAVFLLYIHGDFCNK